MDDYLAEQAEKRLQVSSAQAARKANEGAGKKWQDAKEFNREEEEDFFVGSGGKKGRERAKKEKQLVELDGELMRPKDEPSDRRGGRGGRGRGPRTRGDGPSRGGAPRGDGGFRGAPRGGRGGRGGHAPNLQDTNAFPSLGS